MRLLTASILIIGEKLPSSTEFYRPFRLRVQDLVNIPLVSGPSYTRLKGPLTPKEPTNGTLIHVYQHIIYLKIVIVFFRRICKWPPPSLPLPLFLSLYLSLSLNVLRQARKLYRRIDGSFNIMISCTQCIYSSDD